MMESLPDRLASLVRSELRERETLIWTGQPKPARYVRSSIPIVLFGIPWTAFAVFWMAGASGALSGGADKAPVEPDAFFDWFPLFGIPFFLIGFGMLSSPYWMYRRALLTCYALTDDRAIICTVSPFGGIEVRSFRGSDLSKMARREYSDGSGDLVFEEAVSRNGDGAHRTERGFLGIADVRDVEILIRRTLLPSK